MLTFSLVLWSSISSRGWTMTPSSKAATWMLSVTTMHLSCGGLRHASTSLCIWLRGNWSWERRVGRQGVGESKDGVELMEGRSTGMQLIQSLSQQGHTHHHLNHTHSCWANVRYITQKHQFHSSLLCCM